MPDWLTNVGVGIAAAGAGAYGMYQKIMADSRRQSKSRTASAKKLTMPCAKRSLQ